MEKHPKGIKRRVFIKESAMMAAASLFMGWRSPTLFAAKSAAQKVISIPDLTLTNGIQMPMLGFGTNTLNEELDTRSVADAISVGYRLIDTAHIYGNIEAVGEGIKQSGVDRKELFIASKLWVDDSGYLNTKKAFETSIKNWGRTI